MQVILFSIFIHQASDSLASDISPTGSFSRLPAPFGSSHDASHQGTSSQSESSTVANGNPANKSTPSVKKTSSFTKRMKSAVGHLKKGKVCGFLCCYIWNDSRELDLIDTATCCTALFCKDQRHSLFRNSSTCYYIKLPLLVEHFIFWMVLTLHLKRLIGYTVEIQIPLWKM